MITIENLTKTYGTRTVVDDLTFTAPTGMVTGFLGPNGAGKSTTLRMLCGLATPDAGSATIDGLRYRELAVPTRHVGVMLDAGAQHPGRTGRETLHLTALASGLPASVIDAALERVGLTDAAHKRVGAYSLGMRQRLGLAGALLGSPQTLVLDEPANGLDPEGIRWMRELLDEFASDGGTVLLSSHFLGEVQLIADRLVVINQGRLITQGSTIDLTETSDAHLVAATDMDQLAAACTAAGFTTHAADDALRVEGDAEQIGACALSHHLTLTRLEPVRSDLESTFLELTHA